MRAFECQLASALDPQMGLNCLKLQLAGLGNAFLGDTEMYQTAARELFRAAGTMAPLSRICMNALGIETTDELLKRKLESLLYFVKGHDEDICTALKLMARLQADPKFALELARAIVELIAAYLPELMGTIQAMECSKVVDAVCSTLGTISYEVLLSLALAVVTIEAGGALGISKATQALAKLAKAAKHNKILAKFLEDIADVYAGVTRAGRKLPSHRLLFIEKWRKPQFTKDGMILPFKGTKIPPSPIVNAGKDRAGKTISKGKTTVRFDKDGFPEFDTDFEILLEDRFLGTQNHRAHFRESNKRLHDAIQSDPALGKKLGLGQKQVDELLTLDDAPEGYVWHHHQDAGRMQLVAETEHLLSRPHTGGMAIWGGGYR